MAEDRSEWKRKKNGWKYAMYDMRWATLNLHDNFFFLPSSSLHWRSIHLIFVSHPLCLGFPVFVFWFHAIHYSVAHAHTGSAAVPLSSHGLLAHHRKWYHFRLCKQKFLNAKEWFKFENCSGGMVCVYLSCIIVTMPCHAFDNGMWYTTLFTVHSPLSPLSSSLCNAFVVYRLPHNIGEYRVFAATEDVQQRQYTICDACIVNKLLPVKNFHIIRFRRLNYCIHYYYRCLCCTLSALTFNFATSHRGILIGNEY